MAEDTVLNYRQKEILEIVVTSHIKSAAPIGSALVSDILDLSSATIRNVMGELEEIGYICKPHTSAGRIPTTEGYRYYVDYLLKLSVIPDEQRQVVEETYSEVTYSIEAMLNNISHLLSVMTGQAGIACVSNLKFYMEGTSNMVNMPEFRDQKKMRMLLMLLDEKSELIKMLDDDLLTDGVKIHIGEEDRLEILRDLSLITANYKVDESTAGSLGIVGPLRMNYSALIPFVDFFSKTIEAAFGEMGP